MPDYNPLFHMDMGYNWRWYLTDASGRPILMSAHSFFDFEDAKRDYEMAALLMKLVA